MIYSIPFSIPFLEAVTDYLLSQRTIFPIAEWTIYLPTRQACFSLENLLFERVKEPALILPRIIPLGDIDPEEVALVSVEGAESLFSLPSIITKNRRRLLLASLIEKFRYKDQPLSFQQSLIWCESLMKFIDEMRTEGVDLKGLSKLLPDTGEAEHWEKVQEFLNLVSVHWDDILKEENSIESVTWQKHLMETHADFLFTQKPESPIMIAGSLGTIPSTLRLMQVISSLKNGKIILSGLKKGKEREACFPHHPQFFLYRLLKAIKIASEDVIELSQFSSQKDVSFLENMFEGNKLLPGENFSYDHNITKIETSDQGEEAGAIGVAVREALEQGKKKILCISSDQNLLARVGENLKLWGIPTTLRQKSYLATDIGSFLHLVSSWISSSFPLVALAATFKHRFAEPHRPLWDLFEKHILRTWGGHPSLKAIDYHLERKQTDLEPELFARLVDFYESLRGHLSSKDEKINLAHYLERMEAILAWLTGSEKSIENLFLDMSPEYGSLFQELWQDLKKSSSLIFVYPNDCSEIFFNFLHGQKVPCSSYQHETVSLMTPAEARFVDADFKVLAGLNEGMWPSDLSIDPFFSPAMRRSLKLLPLEARLGQSAHDFLSYVCNGEVLITRSLRISGLMAVPSRFLSYLEMAFEQQGLKIPTRPHFKTWAKKLYQASQRKILTPPHPIPPLGSRPNRLSITDISLLLRDPYSIYAKHILKLKALENFESNDNARLFGIFVHDFLHRWKLKQKSVLNTLFLDHAKFLFELYLGSIEEKHFWWQKFLTLVEWLKQQGTLENTLTEIKGEFTFLVGENLFTVFGKADRIDWDQEGAILIDYKTGSIPSYADIKSGKAPQMPLEALIFLKGGFSKVPSLSLKDIQYWKLLGPEGGLIASIGEDITSLVGNAEEGLKKLITSFYDRQTPYLSHPKEFLGWGPYDHLSRVQEWYFRES